MSDHDVAEVVAGLAAQLGRLLSALDAGALDASAPMRYRLEGAIAALAAVQGDRQALDRLGLGERD